MITPRLDDLPRKVPLTRRRRAQLKRYIEAYRAREEQMTAEERALEEELDRDCSFWEELP
jgi:hypothetical protein